MQPAELDRKVAASTIWTGIDFGVTFLSGLVLAAVFLRSLGPTTYGVYLLLLLFSTPGLLNLVDLGMGGVLLTYTARYRAESSARLRRLWSFAFIYYGVLVLLVAALTSVVIVVFDPFIEAGLKSIGVSRSILVPVLILQSLSLLGLMLEYMLAGTFDYRPIQVSSITMQIVRVVGSSLILIELRDLETLMWWVMICALGRTFVLAAILAVRHRGYIHVDRVRPDEARGWLTYSTSLFARNVAGLVFNFSDRLIIPWFLPISSLAEYDVAAKAPNMIRALLSISTSAVVPAAATNVALEQRDRLRNYYLRGGRIASVGFIPPLCFFLVTMPAFIEVWVGSRYVHMAPVAQVFLGSFILAMVPAIGDAMLLGMGEARRTVKVTWIASATNLVVSLSLVRPLGILGVVIGTVAGAVVSDVWLSIIHWKVLGISPRVILKEIIRPTAVIALLSLLVSLLLNMALGPSTPVAFLVSGVISACAMYTLGFFIALDRSDRAVAIRVARQLIGVRGVSGSASEPPTPALLGTTNDRDGPR